MTNENANSPVARPLLMSAPMVRALLDGRKTMTRRVVKLPQPRSHPDLVDWHISRSGRDRLYITAAPDNAPVFETACGKPSKAMQDQILRCPYGRPGDLLWVREAHAFVPEPAYRCSTGIYQQINPDDSYQACVYREGFDRACGFPWRPSIHMPRWASRLTLRITDVRVDRLQEISEADARAEGCNGGHGAIPGYDYSASPREQFRNLWNSINGPSAWSANPWVWVLSFEVLQQNVDAVLAALED